MKHVIAIRSQMLIAVVALLSVASFLIGDNVSAGIEPYTEWTPKADIPTERTLLGVAAAGNGLIYTFGGERVETGDLATVEEYDPTTPSCPLSSTADLPRPLLLNMLSCRVDTRVWCSRS